MYVKGIKWMDDRLILLSTYSRHLSFYKFDKDSESKLPETPWKVRKFIGKTLFNRDSIRCGLVSDLRAKRGDRTCHTVITWHTKKTKYTNIVWDVKTGQKIKKFKTEGELKCYFSPLVAFRIKNQMFIQNVETGTTVQQIPVSDSENYRAWKVKMDLGIVKHKGMSNTECFSWCGVITSVLFRYGTFKQVFFRNSISSENSGERLMYLYWDCPIWKVHIAANTIVTTDATGRLVQFIFDFINNPVKVLLIPQKAQDISELEEIVTLPSLLMRTAAELFDCHFSSVEARPLRITETERIYLLFQRSLEYGLKEVKNKNILGNKLSYNHFGEFSSSRNLYEGFWIPKEETDVDPHGTTYRQERLRNRWCFANISHKDIEDLLEDLECM